MNKLDRLVKQMILNWPTVCASRWDALRALYIVPGSGFEWATGADGAVIAPVCRMNEPEVAQASFFADIDQQHASAGFRSDSEGRRQEIEDEFSLLRLEREFLLDHLDLIVGKRRHHLYDLGTLLDELTADSNILTIPPDVEESFRAGALEVITAILPSLTTSRDIDLSVSGYKLIHALTTVRNNIVANQL